MTWRLSRISWPPIARRWSAVAKFRHRRSQQPQPPARVGKVYRAFLNDVARGRGVDVATVKEKFGRGRVIDARRARVKGMIDRIGTFDQALSSLLGTGRGGAAVSMTPPRAVAPGHNPRHRRLAILRRA